jgi:hypothetical protein
LSLEALSNATINELSEKFVANSRLVTIELTENSPYAKELDLVWEAGEVLLAIGL